jgi:hypothetical protein
LCESETDRYRIKKVQLRIHTNEWRSIMKRNIGSIERIARIVGDAGIMSLAVVGPQSLWALLGAIPLVTGLVGWCPPYWLLGINTCGKCEAGKKICCG